MLIDFISVIEMSQFFENSPRMFYNINERSKLLPRKYF